MLEESFTWRGDQQVRWSRYGSGPPVVFCHGTPWSSALWKAIADALSSDFTVYLWDMLGYGASTMAEGQDVSLAAQGALLTKLLEHWELTEPHLVAHDYGGAVSLRAHLLQGARYRSLALVDVVALAPWGSEFFRLVAENSAVFAQVPPPLHEALVHAYITGAAHRPLGLEQLNMLLAPGLDTEGQAAFCRQIAQADQRYTDEIEPLYPTMDLPVLVAWGVEDTWIPVDRAHRLGEPARLSRPRPRRARSVVLSLAWPGRVRVTWFRWW